MKPALAVVAFLLALALPAAAQPAAPGRFEEAMEAYGTGHFDRAARLLEEEAREGNALACEILGQMHLYGESLYGPGIPVNLPEARRWLRCAAAEGSPVARLLLARTEARLAKSSR